MDPATGWRIPAAGDVGACHRRATFHALDRTLGGPYPERATARAQKPGGRRDSPLRIPPTDPPGFTRCDYVL